MGSAPDAWASPTASNRGGRAARCSLVRSPGFEQDSDGVRATLAGDGGERTVRAGYLIGCDGAHSAVRKGSA